MDEPDDVMRALLGGLPHARALGMEVVSAAEGVAVLRVPYDARLVGDPTSGVIHGGVVTTLLDTACGVAAMTAPGGAASTATLDLRIDYMRPARAGEAVTARAEVHRVTRSVAFVRAVAWDRDAAEEVASAAGAFMIERAGAKP